MSAAGVLSLAASCGVAGAPWAAAVSIGLLNRSCSGVLGPCRDAESRPYDAALASVTRCCCTGCDWLRRKALSAADLSASSVVCRGGPCASHISVLRLARNNTVCSSYGVGNLPCCNAVRPDRLRGFGSGAFVSASLDCLRLDRRLLLPWYAVLSFSVLRDRAGVASSGGFGSAFPPSSGMNAKDTFLSRQVRYPMPRSKWMYAPLHMEYSSCSIMFLMQIETWTLVRLGAYLHTSAVQHVHNTMLCS